MFICAPASRFRSAAQNNIGSALVELSLVLPIFLLLTVGSAEFGRLAYAAIEVTNAARAGVAYGAQSHVTASDPTGMRVSASSDGPNVVPITVYAGPCLCPSASATASVPACSTKSFIAGTGAVSYPFTCPSSITSTTEFVQVNTSASVSTFLHYPGLPSIYTLSGSSTMMVAE
jgi:hypothetical protein